MSTVEAPAASTIAPSRRGGLLDSVGSRFSGIAVILALLAVTLVLSLALGSKPISVHDVVAAIFHFDPDNAEQVVVRSLRVPRTIIGLLAGIALGLAGAVMQGLSRNPLADPGILGVNAGAILAVLIAVQYFGVVSLLGYVWYAFAGAGIAVVVVYVIASRGREGASPIKLALAGTAVTALLSSIATMVELSDPRTVEVYRTWALGSLSGRGAAVASEVWPFILVGVCVAAATARMLNALALGDDVARGLGQHVGRARVTAGVAVMILAGAATAAAGPIVFLGLTVPHMARALVGPDYRWILPYSALLAPVLLLAADVIGRLVVRPGELQVGVVTVILGAPVFVFLVRRKNLASL